MPIVFVASDVLTLLLKKLPEVEVMLMAWNLVGKTDTALLRSKLLSTLFPHLSLLDHNEIVGQYCNRFSGEKPLSSGHKTLEKSWLRLSSDVPRARLINFGVSCVTKERSCYKVFASNRSASANTKTFNKHKLIWSLCFLDMPNHAPPEFLFDCSCRAGPTTVWQLGVVLHEALHQCEPFLTRAFFRGMVKISKHLSQGKKNSAHWFFFEHMKLSSSSVILLSVQILKGYCQYVWPSTWRTGPNWLTYCCIHGWDEISMHTHTHAKHTYTHAHTHFISIDFF